MSDDMPAHGRLARFGGTLSKFMRCRWCSNKLERRRKAYICPTCDAPDPANGNPFAEFTETK